MELLKWEHRKTEGKERWQETLGNINTRDKQTREQEEETKTKRTNKR